MASWKQYGVLVVGLLMAGGFAFGGMASYSQMINSSPQGEGEEIDAELPDQNFREGGFNLSAREMMYLAAQNDAVFVSAVYNSTEGREQLMGLSNITENFNGRAYLTVVEASKSESVSSYAITNFPTVLVYGRKALSQSPAPVPVRGELTSDNVETTMCSTMQNWNNVRAFCAS